jgi:hypothetical protein
VQCILFWHYCYVVYFLIDEVFLIQSRDCLIGVVLRLENVPIALGKNAVVGFHCNFRIVTMIEDLQKTVRSKGSEIPHLEERLSRSIVTKKQPQCCHNKHGSIGQSIYLSDCDI